MTRTAAAILSLAALTGSLASAQGLQRINPPGLSTPTAYTHIVRVDKTLYIAGQVGARADGTLAGDTMAAQFEQTLANLQIALKSQGADFSHVAKVTIFVTSITEFRAPEVVKVREKYFGPHRPASTLVQIAQLANPAYKVEVEAIAVIP